MPLGFKSFKKWASAMLAGLLLSGGIVPGSFAPQAQAAAGNGNVVISQVFGGGGNSGAPYKNDFIELYNPTDHDISLNGWSVQYASAAGTSWQVTPLAGTIAAGGYYLIQEAAGGSNTAPALPAADAVGAISMSGTSGKVALVAGTTAITGAGDPAAAVDFVGFGSANKFEGTAATGTLSNSTAAIRQDLNGERGLDTNDNSADFAVAAPSPRNSAGYVKASLASGAVAAGTMITLFASTVAATVYYSVYYPDDSAAPAVVNRKYTSPIAISEETTIKAYAKTGSTAGGVATFHYTTAAPALSDIAAARVMTLGSSAQIQGIVTYKETSGGKHNLYVQDDTAGIVVRGAGLTAQIGDKIKASGKITDYYGLAELEAGAADVEIVQAGAGAPSPALINSQSFGEAYEGQLVKVRNVAVGTGNSYNEYTVADEQGQFIVKSALIETGKHYEEITGVVAYAYNHYMLIPRSASDVTEKVLSVLANPAPGFVSPGTAVRLSTPAAGADIYYTVDGSTPTVAEAVYYETPIVVNVDTTIKAIAASGDGSSAVCTFPYTIQQTYEHIRIHDIQGAAHASPYAGHLASGVEGIVTMKLASGNFFMQEPAATYDADDRTSEAILVEPAGGTVNVGDLVSVSGIIAEAKEKGYADANDLTTTRIAAASVTVVSGNNPLPAPIVIGRDRIQPKAVIDNDGMSVFDPDEDALDFYESLESMRVQVNDARIIGPFDYEVPVVAGDQPDEIATPNGGLLLTSEDLNPQRILIAQNPGQPVRTGDRFDGPIVGVQSYDYGNYKIVPETLPAVVKGAAAREATSLAYGENKLTVASFNIENFWDDPQDADRKNKIAQAIVDNLKTPDIVGLIEVQDNNGDANDGTTDASLSFQALIAAIQANGGPEYAFTDIAPENNADGGAPGGNIRVGFLYNPSRVALAPSQNGKGGATDAVGYGAQGLTYNPGRIDPANEAFVSSRKPLAAEFAFQGKRVIVIANHFNSKSGDPAPFGAAQPLPETLPSEVQRHKIAAAVNGFVKNVLDQNPNANVVVLGDLNDFQFSKTLEIVKGNELVNLADSLPANERYSYIYQGNSQTLDHILVNKRLAPYAQLDFVHINADFAEEDGRVSDHDPLLARISLADKEDVFPLTVMHLNDTHANLDNVARRVTAIKQVRSETGRSILLDAGDVFSGTLYFNKYLGKADLEFMNMIGYDAMTFGNHEFDKGPAVLADFVKDAKFPFVGANVDFSREPALSGYFADAIGAPGEAGKIYPAIVLDAAGEKVGVFGLTTEETAALSSPGENIAFGSCIDKAKETVKRLQDEGINKIIALTHLGYNYDRKLAEAVDGIDIIVGGHSHTNLPEPVLVGGGAEPTIIVQAEDNSKFLGRLDVEFDQSGVLKAWNGRLLDLNAKAGDSYVYAEDQEAKAKLDVYKAELETLKTQIVGKTDVILDGERRNVRTKETNLGNLIADGMAAKAREMGVEATIAIQNGGGIRASIGTGDISLGEVMTAMPFGNNLVALEMTGQEIIDSLENGVSDLQNAGGRFPQVSGLRFYYDSTKAAGQRIVQVQVKTAGGYRAIDPNATYFVATNAFIANGGDYYAAMKKAKDAGRFYELFVTDYQVFIDYLAQVGTVRIETEGRIVDLQGSPLPSTEPVDDDDDDDDNDDGGKKENRAGTTDASAHPPAQPGSETGANGRPVAVTAVTAETFKEMLRNLSREQHKLVVDAAPAANGGAKVELPFAALRDAAGERPDAVLAIKSADAAFSIPLMALSAPSVSRQLGGGPSTIGIAIEPAGEQVKRAVEQAAKENGLTLLSAVLDFTVTAESGDNQAVIASFGDVYAERTITVNGAVDPDIATAVRYDSKTGRIHFVPSTFSAAADNKTQVAMKRNGNSYYAVVSSSKTFADIKRHWAQKSIERLASKLIVNGVDENEFQPSAPVTRAEFISLLVRSLGLDQDQSSSRRFRDVASGAWYAASIEAAVQAGLISGYDDGTFRPSRQISRQEMALIVSSAVKYAGETVQADPKAQLASFKDEAGIAAWAKQAVAESVAAGIVQGNPDGTFAPESTTTRAEAVTMLERMLRHIGFID